MLQKKDNRCISILKVTKHFLKKKRFMFMANTSKPIMQVVIIHYHLLATLNKII